jgi:hypothetical protein
MTASFSCLNFRLVSSRLKIRRGQQSLLLDFLHAMLWVVCVSHVNHITCEILGFLSGIAIDTGLQGCCAILLDR